MNAQPGSYLRKTVDCFTRPGAVQLVNEDKEQLTADYLRCDALFWRSWWLSPGGWTVAHGRTNGDGCSCIVLFMLMGIEVLGCAGWGGVRSSCVFEDGLFLVG